MIIDVTGVELTPGNNGDDCLGNGEFYDQNGEIIECCCDECDYMMCCMIMIGFENCKDCEDEFCPNVGKEK